MYFRKVVHPDDEISIDVPVTPRRLGDRSIVATYSSDEVTDVDGVVTLHVVSKTLWDEENATEESKMEANDVTDGDVRGGGETVVAEVAKPLDAVVKPETGSGDAGIVKPEVTTGEVSNGNSEGVANEGGVATTEAGETNTTASVEEMENGSA